MFNRSKTGPRDKREDIAGELYREVVAQSRRPEFYSDCGVPDTLDGRFDLILLHAFLVLHRLKRDGGGAADLAQGLFDTLFIDMDRSLREMGAGDMGIGKRIKSMVEAFYGRVAAYEAGLERQDDQALETALRRNLYGTSQPEPRHVAAMASYLKAESQALAAQDLSTVESGVVKFGAPPAAGATVAVRDDGEAASPAEILPAEIPPAESR